MCTPGYECHIRSRVYAIDQECRGNWWDIPADNVVVAFRKEMDWDPGVQYWHTAVMDSRHWEVEQREDMKRLSPDDTARKVESLRIQ